MPEQVTEARIREIYADTLEGLYGYVSRKCGGDRALAEDVTQETWLRAVREWPRVGIPEVPLAWLTVVARNLILNHFRHRDRTPTARLTPDELLAVVDDDRVGESTEVASIVTRALEKLPKGQARLLEAFHFERAKVSQIAGLFGMSERAVEGRLRRARGRLRREIEIELKAEGGMS